MSDLAMIRGDTPSFNLDINNPDGSPYVLTGAVLTLTAKRHGDDPDYRALVRKSTDQEPAGITITDAVLGLARVDMFAADTRDIHPPMALLYDVQVTFGNGINVTPITGTLTIGADATRS